MWCLREREPSEETLSILFAGQIGRESHRRFFDLDLNYTMEKQPPMCSSL